MRLKLDGLRNEEENSSRIAVAVSLLSQTLLQAHGLWPTSLLTLGLSQQKCWSGEPFPLPGDLPDSGLEPESPALAGAFFTTEPPEKPLCCTRVGVTYPSQPPLHCLCNGNAISTPPAGLEEDSMRLTFLECLVSVTFWELEEEGLNKNYLRDVRNLG